MSYMVGRYVGYVRAARYRRGLSRFKREEDEDEEEATKEPEEVGEEMQ
jgi:hypothetical protein